MYIKSSIKIIAEDIEAIIVPKRMPNSILDVIITKRKSSLACVSVDSERITSVENIATKIDTSSIFNRLKERPFLLLENTQISYIKKHSKVNSVIAEKLVKTAYASAALLKMRYLLKTSIPDTNNENNFIIAIIS